MKVIRDSIFETNSSSAHALIYRKCEKPDNFTEIKLDYYGWGYEVLSTIQEKLSYFFTYSYVRMLEYDVNRSAIESEEAFLDDLNNYIKNNECTDYLKKLNEFKDFKKLVKIVKKHSDFKLIKIEEIGIDHQSVENKKLKEFKNLEEIIYNDNYGILICNDNYNPKDFDTETKILKDWKIMGI